MTQNSNANATLILQHLTLVEMVQNRCRTLLLSCTNFSQALRSASSQATSSPSHTSIQPLAASTASSDSCRQPLSGWRSSLAVIGVAAGIVAANLDEVPLTGRMQLHFNLFQPAGATPHAEHLLKGCLDYSLPCRAASHTQSTQVYSATESRAAILCGSARSKSQLFRRA